MKKLIFLTFLALPMLAFAQTPRAEMPTAADGQAIVSQIKDYEVVQMIKETAEFRDCQEEYPFVASDDPTQRTQKLQAAEACFKQKLSNNTDADRLKKLSEALDLQSYKLVKGNSAKEIQEYLTNKMIEALTGVDPAEEDERKIKENLKFGKKKIVDQSVFIQLYKTQLGKNALFEISRFCFEDLRNTVPSTNPAPNATPSFIEHWASNDKILLIEPGKKNTIEDALNTVTDVATFKFGTFSDATDKSKIYGDIVTSIQGANPNPQKVQDFIKGYFLKCGFLIAPLCEKFKSTTLASNSTPSQLELGLATTQPANGTSTGTQQGATATVTPANRGAAACLALERIKEYKKAIANADKVAEYFDEKMQGGNNLAQFMKGLEGEPVKIFGDGSDSQEATIDELTNNTASTFLQGDLSDQLAQDKAEECGKTPELAKCEGFVYKKEDLDKIKQKIELDQTLKREVEMARVRKLVEGNRQDLETYLKDNGFFDILENPDFKNQQMTNDELVKAVGQSFEARKLAMINEINNRLGSRQAKDDTELATKLTPTEIDKIKNDSKEERARLAQVILFNNIITSHLTLQKRDSRTGDISQAGRNLGAWTKEERALEAEDVDTRLFDNLKAVHPDGGSGGGVGDAQIADFSLLDDILGKKPE